MEFVWMETFTNYIDAHIIMGRLQDAGINCWLRDENIVTINPIWTQATGGIKLMVAEDQLNDAKNLMADYRAERRQKYTCPYCGSGNIELISSNREKMNWLGFLLGLIAFDYALAVKTWRCFDCQKEFDEPKETPDSAMS
jgi:DNA-directed RNA polymerase subunit RPC12/RpoP